MGFYDVLFSHTNKDLALKPEDRRAFSLSQPYGTYVMENVLFKISFPPNSMRKRPAKQR